jgi:hypothetical protein
VNPTNEVLGAYIDGELDPAARAAVAEAIARDPEMAARVKALEGLNQQLRGAFKSSLSEPVPARLIEAARGPAQAVVVELATARAAKQPPPLHRRRAFQWAALAASVVVGVFVGRFGFQGEPSTLLAVGEHGISAGPVLASTLSTQLASDPRGPRGVAIGLTFRDKAGAYCRTFTVSDHGGFAGIACRTPDGWRLATLTEGTPSAETGDAYHMAGSTLPAAIRESVAATIDGSPLDADAEAAARQHNWR